MNTMVQLALALAVCMAPPAKADEEVPDLKVTQPLLQLEKSSAVRLTRLSSARLWWNDDNRIVGISLKGRDANNYALSLASNMPGLRTLVIAAPHDNHLTNDGLAPIANVPGLWLLSITSDRLTDGALPPLQGNSTLRVLVLNGNFTDAALGTVVTFPNLKQLDLTQSLITDAGLAQLTQLPRIETLILNGTQITNAGLQQIVQLKTLKSLYLGDTTIDDNAIEQLAQMEQLELLFIRNTHISADGVARLLPSLLPACRIIHQSGTYRGERERDVAMAPSTPPQSRAAR